MLLPGLALLVGGVVTVLWLQEVPWESIAPGTLLHVVAALLVVCCFTTGNLFLRWLRWHFLARRMGIFFRSRRSLHLYFATLPVLIVPLYLGELVRPWLIGTARRGVGRRLVGVWVIERGIDVGCLGVLWIAAQGAWGAAATALLLLGGGVAFVLHHLRKLELAAVGQRTALSVLTTALVTGSLAAWLLPALSFALALRWLGVALDLSIPFDAFTEGTLIGGVSGLPLGMGVTGNYALQRLAAAGAAMPGAILAVFAFRAGTAWFAVALGAVVAVLAPRIGQLLGPDTTADHFDGLAPEYGSELPEHIRARLLERKVDILLARVPRPSRPLCALDIGCGQGWYAIELARRGHTVTGVDASAGQISAARAEAERAGVTLDLHVASAGSLPFPDETFDVAYAVNVLHHVIDLDERERAFGEIVRVLRSGGRFFLHEMNTRNPLFRTYMSYVFPLLRRIDEGNEAWIHPRRLPVVAGARWLPDIDWFTFLPDFLPARLLAWLAPLERRLERSPWLRELSAHYLAVLEKEPATRTDPTLAPPRAPQPSRPPEPAG